MNKSQIEQINYCLKAKRLCNALKTYLFLIDDFDDYKYYAKKLDKLRKQVDEIYWSL